MKRSERCKKINNYGTVGVNYILLINFEEI